jgi:ribosome-binding factor A
MPLSHRVERVAEQIREEVSQILATEVADPGVGLVTVTRVKVTPDLSLARVYWTIMGDAAQRKETTKALARAAGFVRRLLSQRMTLRRSPEVTFLFDQSVAAQDRVEQILYELKQEAAAREAAAVESPDAPDAPKAPDAAETPAAPVPPVTSEE